MRSEALEPFGLVVHGSGDWRAVPAEQIEAWVAEHRVVVFRGFDELAKRELPLAARRLGPLQAWSFGAVNELRIDRDRANYLFTEACVPLHWDGAFKGEIPHYLVFHCLEAPPPDVGGETVFVDAVGALEQTDATTRECLTHVRFRYSTEKVVHYGGTFEADAVGRHPTSGQAVLRFAEPVHDLNAVSVEKVSGDVSVERVQSLLTDPALRLEHSWRDGDIVVADNHALLHGRNGFSADAGRHLRRVNVLGRERAWYRPFTDSLRIRRPEFMVAEIPILLIASLLVPEPFAFIGSAVWWEAAVCFFLLFHFGDMINCYADRELDSVYKTPLSEAVYGLGERNVITQMVLTVVTALLLAAHLSWSLQRPVVLVLVAIGLMVGHQYSVGPGRFKGRGIAQIFTLWTIVFVGPMLLIASVAPVLPDPSLLGIVAAYGFMQEGVILVNTAEDFDEDVASGIKTSAVALGREAAVFTAAAMVFSGGALLISLLLARALAADGSGVTYYALGILTSSWSWVVLEIGGLWWFVRRSSHPDQTLKAGAAKMPVWITGLAWTTLLVCIAAAFWG